MIEESLITQNIKPAKNIFSYKTIKVESAFRRSLIIVALIVIVLVFGIFLTLTVQSIPSLKSLGIGYLCGKTWDPVADEYGALTFLLGIFRTSFLAINI